MTEEKQIKDSQNTDDSAISATKSVQSSQNKAHDNDVNTTEETQTVVQKDVNNDNEGSGRSLPVKILYLLLHIAMLVLSIFLIISISMDTFNGVPFYENPKFLRTQTWICAVFLADFFVEFFMAKRKWRYLATHFIFFLVSIPYLFLIHHFGWQFPPEVTYVIQFIPMVRGGYALAMIVGWFTYNRATGLFVTYLVTLLATVYFASLVFYLFEHGPNKLVENYQDALWWAAMDVTTVGSNIVAVTAIGRVLSVLLAAMGMMMFPIFTVYVTSLITQRRQTSVTIFDKRYNDRNKTEIAQNQ